MLKNVSKFPGMYNIPGRCDNVYTGPTSQTIKTRIKWHHHNIRLHQRDRPALAEQKSDMGQKTMLKNPCQQI